MNIEFRDTYSLLNHNEWKNNIKNYLNIIKGTDIGTILLNEINNYTKGPNKYNITITNYSNTKIIQYPHVQINDRNIMIIIPSNPYFINVDTFNEELISGFEVQPLVDIMEDINNIINRDPVKSKLDETFVTSFTKNEFQPMVVILFHELIHVLRGIKNIESNDDEEAVIYGLADKTLKINERFITENTFRKELNLGARISHNSNLIFAEGIKSFKISKEELKKMYQFY